MKHGEGESQGECLQGRESARSLKLQENSRNYADQLTDSLNRTRCVSSSQVVTGIFSRFPWLQT